MTVVAAFLVPGSPLLVLRPENLPWARLLTGYQRASRALAAARPDAVVVYSTQWIAVLDQLWQTRPRVHGVHVDENWYEFGDIAFDIRIDTELAYGCVASSARYGIRAKAVNYDGFPIDGATVVAERLLNANGKAPWVLTSNNIYHDWQATERLGRLAAEVSNEQGKKIAVVGVGGLSGTSFRTVVDIREDRIFADEDDRWNRRTLEMIERGDIDGLRRECPKFVAEARVDMGFKHFAFVLGALGGRFYGARTHAYGPLYGSGGAVVEFKL